jgi:hypothetical protein
MAETSLSAQDYADITNQLNRYAWALDLGDLKALGELFTPDGLMQDTSGKRYDGRDALVGYARELINTPAFRGRQHIIYNLVVDQGSADRCQTRSYWTVIKWDGETNEKKIDGTGHSEDLFVKINGKWLFKERLVHRWSSTNGPWVGK